MGFIAAQNVQSIEDSPIERQCLSLDEIECDRLVRSNDYVEGRLLVYRNRPDHVHPEARDVSRGEKIDPRALADLAGTCLGNGTELDALAKLPAAEQRSLAEAAKRGEKVSAITARSACDPEDPKTSDETEEIELGKVIARLRRDQPRNADTMLICDALERRLKRQ